MDFQEQIERGVLVCPRTYLPLRLSSARNSLITTDGGHEYPLLEGKIPVLLLDEGSAESYWASSQRMTTEYQPEAVRRRASLWYWIKTHDYRCRDSVRAFDETFGVRHDDCLVLASGGGPNREPPNAMNVNIGPFPNVDVVADALCLPYADDSVDAICCQAVLEHLPGPSKAANEM